MLKEAWQHSSSRSDGAAARTPHTDALHPRRTNVSDGAGTSSDLQSRDPEKRAPPLYFESQTEASRPSKATENDLRAPTHVQLAHTYRYRCGGHLHVLRDTEITDDRFGSNGEY